MQNTPYYTPYNQSTPGSRRALKIFHILALLLLGGLAGTVQFHTYLTYQTYQQGRCTIQSGDIERHSSKSRTYYTPILRYTVQAQNGQTAQASGYDAPYQDQYSSTSAQRIVDNYKVGQSYDCWYDPANPTHAVLVYRGYSFGNLAFDYILTAFLYFIGLLILSSVFTYGVYRPTVLMTRGALTQGRVMEHVRKRQKNGYRTYSRIAFQSQNYPYAAQTFETSGAYPIGSLQPVCYDPENLKNAKQGGRPTGCGPALVTLFCLGLLAAGAGVLWYIWNSV